MIDTEPPKPTVTDRPSDPDEPVHRSTRGLAILGSLWSTLIGGGYATPPEAFEPFLEQGIAQGRSVRTIWARALALGGALFWISIAFGSWNAPLWAGAAAVVVVVSALVGWRWDKVAGWLFIVEALLLAAYLIVFEPDRLGFLFFSLPAALTGLLFLTGRRPR